MTTVNVGEGWVSKKKLCVSLGGVLAKITDILFDMVRDLIQI